MRTWRIKHLFVLSIIVATSPGICTAEEQRPIEWVETYKEARELGIEQGKPVLLFVTTDHCVHCVKMLDSVFTDQSVVNDIHSSFVPAKLKLCAEKPTRRRTESYHLSNHRDHFARRQDPGLMCEAR